jgi:NAD(P)-dependent dehydrogenase (short-subunit alcohol dehydrogenase family)
MRDLDGRVAVVTGAASGIGRSLAGRLTIEGMHVVLADVEERALRDAVAGIGGDAVGFTTDVTSAESVEALSEFAYDTFGAVHLLCNNAGVFQGGLMWECSDADFEWTLGVNVMGIVHGVRAFVPRMLAAGAEGHVVNTVSMAGLATTPFSGPYDVSKFGAMAATECLAHDLASVGASIKVSAVVPASSTPGSAGHDAIVRRTSTPRSRRAARSSSRRWPTAPPAACRPRPSPTWSSRPSARSTSSCPRARAIPGSSPTAPTTSSPASSPAVPRSTDRRFVIRGSRAG